MNNQETRRKIAFAFLLILGISSSIQAQDKDNPLEILKKVDANQSYSTIRYEGKMEIYSGSRVKTKTMLALSSGSDKAFIEFTNPEDRGVRMLKLNKNIWMYFPSERDTVKISGALLRQGLMGSDFSYEDAMESDELLTRYSASLLGQESIDGRLCHVLELLATAKDVAYSKRKLWIDSELFIVRKSEMYARSGLLLKTSRTLATTALGGRHFPSVVELSDALKKNSRTVMTMTSLSINIELDDSKFSLQALTR
jgi:outer membrane lipoprotein-sorting protein